MGGFATEISFEVGIGRAFKTLKYRKLYEKKIRCYKSQEASVTSKQLMEENLETQSIHLQPQPSQALLVSTSPSLLSQSLAIID